MTDPTPARVVPEMNREQAQAYLQRAKENLDATRKPTADMSNDEFCRAMWSNLLAMVFLDEAQAMRKRAEARQ